MISRNQIKLIQSLRQKKYRERYGLFVVEGEKMVGEFLKSDFEIENIYATNQWEEKQQGFLKTNCSVFLL